MPAWLASPDLVFAGRHKVIFVHGCYCHMHACKYGRVIAKTNAAFWREKRQSNVERDRRNVRELARLGWKVLVVWECSLRKPQHVKQRVVAFVTADSTPADALRNTLDLAQHAERWGFRRFWLAEHHNMIGIASAATAVVIGYVAAGTRTIRVGAGGIMLPNHSPLVIAEQFGTLESLYPGRIDLGLGRAPGTDRRTLLALRRDPSSADSFPQDVLELQALLGPLQPGQTVQAVPGTDTNVPLWILGSSLFGSQLAAMLGLPYAFA